MSGADELLRWCEDQNQHPVSKQNGWWYYVVRNPDTGSHSIQKLDGGMGEEVQRYASGRWKPDFSNWSESDLNRYEAKLRGFLNKGRAPAQGEMI